jgi:hypothetical protein
MRSQLAVVRPPVSDTGDDSFWNLVADVMKSHFYQPDLEAVRAAYSAIAAHALSDQPVWTMSVAPPGSMKTTILEPLEQFEQIHFIDEVTPNTFLSGQIRGKSKRMPSLLDRIGKSGVIVIADFSTILSMKHDDRAAVLAQLRRIFDGHFHKEVGTLEGSLDWKGRITCAVAVTKEIDKHFGVFQSLGERFLMVRWPRPGGEDEGEAAALRAMSQNIAEVRSDLKEVVGELFDGLLETAADVTVTPEQRQQIAAISEFVVRGRTHVSRDASRDRNLNYVPEAEAPTRLAQQLCQLAKGSARLGRRRRVNVGDMELVRRVGFNCIPSLRWRVLQSAARSAASGLPGSTESNIRADLKCQGIGLLNGKHELSEFAIERLSRAGYEDWG